MLMKRLDSEMMAAAPLNPYYKRIQSALNGGIKIEGKTYIDLASNNYMGLANADVVKKRAADMIGRYGVSMCGTPIATGYIDLMEKAEECLASYIGTEDAILFPSCYQANTGVLEAMIDMKDAVLVDHYAHSSLWQGIRHSGAKVQPFLHNDLNHPEKCLKRQKCQGCLWVVTESVFSTEGSIAPLSDMNALCRRYDAILVVDDSHGLGVIGRQGRGALDHAGLEGFSGIYTASLGKGLGNSGGVVGGPKDALDYLRYYCPHLVYSTALVPASLGGSIKAVDVLKKEHESLFTRARGYHQRIFEALTQAGFKVNPSETLINSIHMGSFEETLDMAGAFYEKGILTTPFVEPSVPPNQGKLRLIAGAELQDEQVEQVCRAIRVIGGQV